MYYLCTLQVCVRMRRTKCPIAENIYNKKCTGTLLNKNR